MRMNFQKSERNLKLYGPNKITCSYNLKFAWSVHLVESTITRAIKDEETTEAASSSSNKSKPDRSFDVDGRETGTVKKVSPARASQVANGGPGDKNATLVTANEFILRAPELNRPVHDCSAISLDTGAFFLLGSFLLLWDARAWVYFTLRVNFLFSFFFSLPFFFLIKSFRDITGRLNARTWVRKIMVRLSPGYTAYLRLPNLSEKWAFQKCGWIWNFVIAKSSLVYKCLRCWTSLFSKICSMLNLDA